MKRPSFQFYPGDWLMDSALRVVSVGARGAWMDMLCLMHQADPYGHLKVNGKVILPANLARMIGATLPEAEGFLAELEEAGVFSRGDDGCIFSRRMIRDEQLRQVRAAGGKLGGNPKLKSGNGRLEGRLTSKVNQNTTPSSSSSSSSSIQETPVVPEGDSLVQAVLSVYHDTLPKCERIAAITPKRVRRIKTADKLARTLCAQQGWDYTPAGFWGAYFDECAADPWMRGDVPNPKNPRWKQNLDVLLAEDRFASVMDRAIASMQQEPPG
jgi:hypothetical protein